MWYVIAELTSGRIAWWGAYKNETDADTVAERVNGVAIMIKDLKKFAKLLNQAEAINVV